MLEQFKSFDMDRLDVDELVALAAFGRQLRNEYEALKVAEPEFVDTNLKSLRREIDGRLADRRETRIRELRAQREGLKSAQEKREAIDRELAELEATHV